MNNKTGDETLFPIESWIQSVTDFWESMKSSFNQNTSSNNQNTSSNNQNTSSNNQNTSPNNKNSEQINKFFQTTNKQFQLFMSMLSEPENVNAFFKGADAIPEVILKLMQELWDSYFEIQSQVIERAVRIGKETKAYNFEGIDQTIFRTWKEIYEKEFQKYLYIPQIGLTRYYQERIAQLVDKHTLFQESMAEFTYLIYVPIEKATAVMREKLESMTEQGEIHTDSKAYYNMWLKILEGHYMTLLKSSEYTNVMKNTIETLIEYKKAKDDIFYDILQHFPIPTNRDMDEVYKEIYLLKKKVKELSKKLEKHEKQQEESSKPKG